MTDSELDDLIQKTRPEPWSFDDKKVGEWINSAQKKSDRRKTYRRGASVLLLAFFSVSLFLFRNTEQEHDEAYEEIAEFLMDLNSESIADMSFISLYDFEDRLLP